MYTVKELIEALKQCPQDDLVFLKVSGVESDIVESVSIDNENQVVTIFGRY